MKSIMLGSDVESCGDHVDAKDLQNLLLGPKHRGLKISASGLLGRIRDGSRLEKTDRWMLGELLKHMEELGSRYYSGDVKVCDEFLQLYCCDKARPE